MRAPFPGSLLAISDRRRLEGPWPAWIDALASAGVPALQVREKDLSDAGLFHLVGETVERIGDRVAVLVNGRADVAAACGAAGVHLPATEVPVGAVRSAFPGLVIGRSTHGVDEVCRAGDDGADFVVFGPVFPTESKPGAGGVGLDALAEAAEVGIPVLALGGVDPSRFRAVAAAGAAGAAGIGMFLSREGIGPAVKAAREVFRWE